MSNFKHTPEMKQAIKTEYETFGDKEALSIKYNVSVATIKHILNETGARLPKHLWKPMPKRMPSEATRIGNRIFWANLSAEEKASRHTKKQDGYAKWVAEGGNQTPEHKEKLRNNHSLPAHFKTWQEYFEDLATQRGYKLLNQY